MNNNIIRFILLLSMFGVKNADCVQKDFIYYAIYGSTPLRISSEFSVILHSQTHDSGFSIVGFSISPEVGIGGGKIGLGYYKMFKNPPMRITLLSYSGRFAFFRTWGKPLGIPKDRNFVGFEGHFNFLFLSLKGGWFISVFPHANNCFTYSIGAGI